MDPVTKAVLDLVLAIIGLVAAITGAKIVPLIESRVGSARLALLEQAAAIVVKAVEAAAAAGILQLPKKDAAVKFLRAEAERLGLHPTDEQVSNLIEAAVADLKRLGGELHTKAQSGTSSTATQTAHP